MTRHSMILLSCLFWTTVLTTRAQKPEIVVGPNVQVSTAKKNRPHTEVWVAANPRDPNHLLGCSIVLSQSPYKGSTIAYVSFDGGRSWTPTLETDEFFMSSDPGCTIGFDGTAYFVADVRTSPERIFTKVYRSKDGGRTWLPHVDIIYVGRPSIIVDSTHSKYRGQIYINGWGSVRDLDGNGRAAGLTLSRSLNAGESFESPVIRAPLTNPRHYVNAMGNCVIKSNGNIVCAFSQSNDDSPIEQQVQSVRLKSDVKVLSSADGGRSFSDAVIIGTFYMLRRPPGTTNHFPAIAVDTTAGSFRDRLYLIWPDVASGRSQISFSYSSNGGKTWTRPQTINDDEPFNRADPSQGPDDFMPVVAVNPDGVVGVMWYDRRHDPKNLGWHVRFRASLDGGETFLPSVRISEAPAAFERDEQWPIFYWQSVTGGGSSSKPGGFLNFNLHVTGQLYNGGDYAGMAAGADGRFHPFWADNRTGVHQIWTAPVTVKGAVESFRPLRP